MYSIPAKILSPIPNPLLKPSQQVSPEGILLKSAEWKFRFMLVPAEKNKLELYFCENKFEVRKKRSTVTTDTHLQNLRTQTHFIIL
ncbi:MAG: hypothetical protein A2X61_12195 [Ignavibacteria bacterium GWB2_35_12]|nr:MAG: hypothetical protein A2X63_06480 [Ignavibacteria bacterium GWA2_35_8]OGU42527.1 MAG: hypothetical protein A2X61_12195 [Ignavibacteria bacterium GWB2_35_12]OGU94804.1 MAG: hypothetical protein A2220_11425 [Ignavibacteria bacterium RIFOXYA2_FULL_35_10]OGV19110.1 MAG: hypothetical protein A2475_00990 [Ignavibacteria bacterium RIFOXYC2_FULL_35_21]